MEARLCEGGRKLVIWLCKGLSLSWMLRYGEKKQRAGYRDWKMVALNDVMATSCWAKCTICVCVCEVENLGTRFNYTHRIWKSEYLEILTAMIKLSGFLWQKHWTLLQESKLLSQLTTSTFRSQRAIKEWMNTGFYSLNTYLLSTYYAPSTVLGTADSPEQDEILPHEVHFSMGLVPTVWATLVPTVLPYAANLSN